MEEKTYKCLSSTHEHVREVSKNVNIFIAELLSRADNHDNSKFAEPELSVFANADELSKVEYGSSQYKENLEKIKPAIEHHYANNRHHPEHWPNGIEDMSLIDIVEMLCDWRAATKRNKNGNIVKSIESNSQKYNISPQLRKILENTIRELYQ